MSAERIEIVISSARQSDSARWEAQRERIQRSGARFEQASRNWRLELDLSDSSQAARALGELFAASRTYGTSVLVIDPATEMPAVTPLAPVPEQN